MSLGSDDVSRESKQQVDEHVVEEPCAICLELLDKNDQHRSIVKLASCDHIFHLDCIGSEFNLRNMMICPTCRSVEQGRWLFARPETPNINNLIRMAEERDHNQLRFNSSLPLTGGLTTAPVRGQPAVLPSVQPQLDAILPSPGYPARSTSSLRTSLDYTPQQQVERTYARTRAANEHVNLTMHGSDSGFRRESSLAYTPQQEFEQWMEREIARNRVANEQHMNRMYGFGMRRSNGIEGGSNNHESLGFTRESSLDNTPQQQADRPMSPIHDLNEDLPIYYGYYIIRNNSGEGGNSRG